MIKNNDPRASTFLNPTTTRWLALAVVAVCCGAVPNSSAAAAPQRARWAGVVTYVVDGDTVYVRPLQGGKPVSIRVDGIDAPEICQPGGNASRDALSQRVLGRNVVIDGRSRDDYGRLLGKILLDGDDVGERMVMDGQAWSYRYRGRGGPYTAQQRLAELASRGIFADSTTAAVYPRVFRKQNGACPH
jgi:micrococcal nuclease